MGGKEGGEGVAGRVALGGGERGGGERGGGGGVMLGQRAGAKRNPTDRQTDRHTVWG